MLRLPPTKMTVETYDEWGLLEEVIVGRIDQAVIAPDHPAVRAVVPPELCAALPTQQGQPFPRELIDRASAELEGFVKLLEAEGVVVHRPDPFDHAPRWSTPHWESQGMATACPRDGILILGNEIIETPMAWRSRYFEMFPYRRLFRRFFDEGARWTSAPKPRLLDTLYDENFTVPGDDEPARFVIDESEIVFDAADFIRCGRDLFCQRSNVTNFVGIEWLRRHLGGTYRIHVLDTAKWRAPMHIDATFVPLAPGRALVNPDDLKLDELPGFLRSWDLIVAPSPDPTPGPCAPDLRMCSSWLSLNVMSLDESRVIVEAGQTSLIAVLRRHGFEVIPLPFEHYAAFGGAFHCATVDVRRRGRLESYFPELD
jgi:glycine amidinotransferase